MSDAVAAFAAQQAELAALLAGAAPADWERPSPCEGWTVADVVLHLAQTNEMAVASAEGRFAEHVAALTEGLGPAGSTVDDAVDALVAAERGGGHDALLTRWQASADAQERALAACDPSARLTWVAGELSARTLATTRLAETWVHTWDVATGLGTTIEPTDRLHDVARLAWRTLPYAFARAGREPPGPVAFELRAPSGATWRFAPDAAVTTTITGDAVDLCLVAGRRVDPASTSLRGAGPDAADVLALVRTYA